MTNREKYKKAFSTLHAPEELSYEILERIYSNKSCKVIEMNGNKKLSGIAKKTVAGLVAAFVLVAGAGTAYAANLGGIQRTVQLWIRGDQTDAVLEINTPDESGSNSYTVQYIDENGEQKEFSGGGIAIDMFGKERPLTEKEIMEQLMQPSVEFREDGSVFVYSLDQKIDITGKFDNDGYCYVTVKQGDIAYYLTINKDGSYKMSTNYYIQP